MVMNIIVNENKVHIIVKDSLLGLLVTGFDISKDNDQMLQMLLYITSVTPQSM